jgi:hypothetical protein
MGIDIDVRRASFEAKANRGMEAIRGRKALYRHLRSIQSSSRPMKPPNRMQTASVNGSEIPFLTGMTLKKYRKKRYDALVST